MLRWLTTTVSVGLIALAAAGVAMAAVTYDPSTQTGFIGRGDVIAAAGKAGLIADPVVTFASTTHYTLTCTWPDQTQVRANLERTFFVVYRAQTRFAHGNETITGYSLSRDAIIDGGLVPPVPDEFICWGLLGRSDDGTPVDLQYQDVTNVQTLTYFAPGGAVQLRYTTP
jgi:hypothetical protein